MSSHATTHDDLMDLASRSSYDSELKVGLPAFVNGKRFVVLHIETDEVTGLTAFTFRSNLTGEITVGFQGTDLESTADLATDALLLTSVTPPQYAAAERYVQAMTARHGPVSSVCGNSLGGGMAAYVAARNPQINAVTVNPAPVPKAYANTEAPNVHNYISSVDVLNRMLKAGGMEDRVIGSTTRFPGTSFHQQFLLANHVGSDLEDGPYDASMAIPFSIFHTDVVLGAGGFGSKVDIDVGALDQLAGGLRGRREDLRAVVDGELEMLERSLEAHARAVPAREAAAREEFLTGVEADYEAAKRLISRVLDHFDATMRSPLVSLPPVPVPLKVGMVAFRAQLGEAVAGIASAVDQLAAFSVRSAAAAVWDACNGPLYHESEVISRGMAAQCQVLGEDLALVDEKWAVLSQNVKGVAREVQRADEEMAAAIASRRCPPDAVRASAAALPGRRVARMDEDLAQGFAQVVAERRQEAVGELVVQLASRLVHVVEPLEACCRATTALMEVAEITLGAAVTQVQNVLRFAQSTPVGVVAQAVGLGDDVRAFSRALDGVKSDFVARSNQIQDIVGSLRRTLDDLPDGVDAMRPYLEASFFADAQIEETYDALLKCRNVVGRASVLFGEVEFQLADHDARMIDALAESARRVRDDLSVTESNLTTMVR